MSEAHTELKKKTKQGTCPNLERFIVPFLVKDILF